MGRLCPICNSVAKTTGVTRHNKHGDLMTYIYCPTCDKKYHVFIGDEGEVTGIVTRYSRRSKEDEDYRRKCREEVARFKMQQQEQIVKPKIKLIQKPQTENKVIEIKPVPIEEAMKTISDYFGGVDYEKFN